MSASAAIGMARVRTTVSSALRVATARRSESSSSAGPAACPPTRLTMAVETPTSTAYPLRQGPSTETGFGYGSWMAQRARRRNSEPRKAPDWVPDELLDRLGLLLRDDASPSRRRKVGRFWPERLDVLLDHAGGSVPPGRAARADRGAGGALRPAARRPDDAAGRPAVAAGVGRDRPFPGHQRPGADSRRRRRYQREHRRRPVVAASPETLLKERDRIAEDLRRERERTTQQGPQAARGARGARRDALRADLGARQAPQLAARDGEAARVGPVQRGHHRRARGAQRGRGRRRGGAPRHPRGRGQGGVGRGRRPDAPSRRSRRPAPTSTPRGPRRSACGPRRRRPPTSCAPPVTSARPRCCGWSRPRPATPSCSR